MFCFRCLLFCVDCLFAVVCLLFYCFSFVYGLRLFVILSYVFCIDVFLVDLAFVLVFLVNFIDFDFCELIRWVCLFA